MFGNLNEFVKGGATLIVDKDGTPSSKELQIAVFSLLLETAKVDGEFEQEELSKMCGSMFREFGLRDDQTGELFELTEAMLTESGKSAEFVQAINEHFDSEQKQIILGMVWKVIVADGKAEKFETAFAAELRKKLGLTLEQAVRARKLGSEQEMDYFLREIAGNGE